MFVAVRVLWRLSADHRSADLNSLAIATTGAFIVWAIHGLVDNSFFVSDLSYATWALLLIHDFSTEKPPPASPRSGSIFNSNN